MIKKILIYAGLGVVLLWANEKWDIYKQIKEFVGKIPMVGTMIVGFLDGKPSTPSSGAPSPTKP